MIQTSKKPAPTALKDATVVASSMMEANEHGKVSTTNTDGLQRAFQALTKEFETELDLHFRSHNQLIKEQKNKIDVQLKASKKEKMRHYQYWAREELTYWSRFPRKMKFYHKGLAEMRSLIVQDKWRDDVETRDLEQIILTLFDLLPTGSQKYCKIFKVEQANFRPPRKGASMTFDKMTENLRMFDSNDLTNWQILGYTVALLVSDALAVMMDPKNKGAQLHIGQDATQIILQQARNYSRFLPRTQEEEEYSVENTVVRWYWNVIQSTWEKQIFHYLSMASRINFDVCLKYLQSALTVDIKKLDDGKKDEIIQQIYFARYLAIAPVNLEMATKVLQLLDSTHQLLGQKVGSRFKDGLLNLSRHMCEFLWFGSSDCSQVNGLHFDPEAMKILWSTVTKLYTVAEHLATKKDQLKEQAYLLMAQILKISTPDFIEQNFQKFQKLIKMPQFFVQKKDQQRDDKANDTLKELKIINQLITLTHTFTQAYKAWMPKTHKIQICYNEDGSKAFTPVEFWHASLDYTRRPLYQIDIYSMFELIYTPKACLPVVFQHWQLLETLTYDNLQIVVKKCIPHLLSFRQQLDAIDFLNLGLQMCRYILDPSKGFRKRYFELHPTDAQFDDSIAQLRLICSEACIELLKASPITKQTFVQQNLHGFRSPQTLTQQAPSSTGQTAVDAVSSWCSVAEPRTSSTLNKKYKKLGATFYLQNKARSITFDDQNEQQRMDYTYDFPLANQTIQQLKKNVQVDKAKEKYVRHKIQSQMQSGDSKSEYPVISNDCVEALAMIANIIDLMPHIDLLKECVLYMPSYHISVKGDFTLKAPLKMSGQAQHVELGKKDEQLWECERMLPTYFLLCLDAKVQEKAQKCILKMMVTHNMQVKLALLDQLLYFIKEMMLDGDSKVLKTLQICLMNAVHVFLWTERTRFSVQDPNVIADCQIIKTSTSDIKYIYSYLHAYRMADMVALIGLCSKELDVRQASMITLMDLSKLKRLMIKKDLWTPLFDDLLYQNQTKLLRNLSVKMGILNGLRDLSSISEDKMSEVTFYQLMIDNFEYQKYGLQEFQVRDLQVMFLGEALRIHKANLLDETDMKTEHVRDVTGGPILMLLQILSQRTLTQFESRNNDQPDGKDVIGFNLLFAIVLSNITKSHQKIKHVSKETQLDDYNEEIITSGDNISTNTILDEAKNLVTMLETSANTVHKMPFGKFLPARIWTSNVLLSYIYYLQDDIETQSRSLENLYEVFIIKRVSYDSKHDFALNCVLFYTMLSQESLYGLYVEQNVQNLARLVNVLETLKQVEILDDPSKNKQTILGVNLTHSICKQLRQLMLKQPTVVSTEILPQQVMTETMQTTRQNYPTWEKSMPWLLPIIKEVWHSIIYFQSKLPQSEELMTLDLKFLIQLEQEGFSGSLDFYRTSKVNSKKKGESTDSQRISEIKILIQQVYAFVPVQPRDQNSILVQKPSSQTQRNVFFRCILSLLDTTIIRQMLEDSQFERAQEELSQKLLGCSFSKLQKASLVPKLFLVCLFITVNSIDKHFVEKARTVCLCILPHMFTADKTFSSKVQEMISQQAVSQLIHFESKQFYQFIKRVFKAEETHNMENHFEKYFSLSGFLRDLLNEIIKLQANASDSPAVQPRMLLKVFDMITYFFGGVNLRRSPTAQDDDSSFIFANLVDFKSFEFLSKLYKITEKLVDYDTENMTIMNMWFKICEGRESNFEVLGKFLIHNLSSFVLKQPEGKTGKTALADQQNQEQEFEKHKRYSLSIFNYIKSRTQQMDLRSSIEINSATWSQKMLKVVLRSRMNLTSKYTLEKMKLKKVLEALHGEINQSDLKLKLRGGLDTMVDVLGAKSGDVRQSISMSSLIQSQTFVQNFSAKKQNSKATLKQLLFILDRQMYDSFVEQTAEGQVQRMPDLLIKYFENTLILIANESERLQVIKFTPKEEFTVTVLLLVLVADLAQKSSSSDSESNRAYFIYDLMYKLSVSIHGVQKYLKQISIEQFCQIKTEQDIMQLFNSRQTLDLFPMFTSVYFKIVANVTLIPKLYSFMLSVWHQTLLKHQAVIAKEQSYQILFGRSQLRQMLQVCFSIVHLISKSQNESSQLAKNFIATMTTISEMVQPSAKHQCMFTNFEQQSSCDIAFGTTILYWLGFACMTEVPFQAIGVQLTRKVLEDSEFYKVLLSLQNVPQTFSNLKLANINRSLVSVLSDVVSHRKVSDDAFKCLIVTIKAQDSLLTTTQGDMAQEEFHRFLLLLPYLLSQFTENQQQVNQSISVFSNKRSIVQLLKKSLPSISISIKSKILQLLDVIQREVDQDDQVLVQEQFQLLIECTVSQLLMQEQYGGEVIASCIQSLSQMLKNRVDSVRPEIIKDALKRIQNIGQNVSFERVEQRTQWLDETIMGEEISMVMSDCRGVYFALKHVILSEIELSQVEKFDYKMYFTGAEGDVVDLPPPRKLSTSDPSNRSERQGSGQPGHQRTYSNEQEPFMSAQSKIHQREIVSKYPQGISSNTSAANQSQAQQYQQHQSDKLAVYQDSPEQQHRLPVSPKGKQFQGGGMLGTFAKEDPSHYQQNTFNQREMEADQMNINQSLSSISVRDNDRSHAQILHNLNQKIQKASPKNFQQPNQSYQQQDRPQTGAFTNDFDFSIDNNAQPRAGLQHRSTMPPQKNQGPLDQQQPRQQNYVQSQSNISGLSGYSAVNFEKQLKLISKDDDTLYELEQHLQARKVDLDELSFYVKVLEFKYEQSNQNIVAGLILDNYLSEDAECYVGNRFPDKVINKLIETFKRAIQDERAVTSGLFDECCAVLRPGLEKHVMEFMNQ